MQSCPLHLDSSLEKKKNPVDGSGEEAELVHCLPSTRGALSWVPTVKLGRVTRGANSSTPGGRGTGSNSRSLTPAALEVLDLPGMHKTVKKKGKE